ncbi:TPA: ribosome-associated translation inhibitor RaiA [Candidatus Nomurabacteria bacterium]|uniref:Ribosomal subunit interface protein n=2 Tax=Candidatus Nomuraibacteriota TaxID=1752729 RepID=A0A1F6YMF0_9BACT|nr:MAG: hypothetical protein UV13_C0003G0015 [Parcubacteria group bacterium GW2011_GWC1_42_21]KKS58533.1 MAG: hypothetical protein UV23_C0005G0015 [Candidatus Nomurabacteria bacterium GW2011_GWF1_42_40]KKT00202.1 MAG: hypothetical protein UV77_C0006G0069 [Candidatus Nomurabacteria bacterium GW2011_GWA1_43_17]KKT07764.1 MAG: hypothetical protein UV85_C0005G0015 [Candidatus Nomurabacteria bacterium GW2011_GWB1_43_19]KKT11652.1 MAG: hypothetical protein UV91_C0003G0041 [Candidatus Nomurabacteria b
MQINFQGKNMELTEAITEYISKRISGLEKLLSGREGEVKANFEVVKTTNHHKAGEIFHASCMIFSGREEFYGETDHEDLYSAIDEIKEILSNEIRKNKDRRQTLFKRGAASVKKMLKGLSRRNPFTSKY